jgi:hypothetical protein
MGDPLPPLTTTADADARVSLSALDPVFVRSYSRHPRKAGQRATWLRQQGIAARARGDMLEADHYDDLAGRYEALLAHLDRCRICGRKLEHPDSVAAGIGPECARDHG